MLMLLLLKGPVKVYAVVLYRLDLSGEGLAKLVDVCCLLEWGSLVILAGLS